MLNEFLDDYYKIILLCANNNYSKEKTEDLLSGLEVHRFITQKQLPRTKELNRVKKQFIKQNQKKIATKMKIVAVVLIFGQQKLEVVLPAMKVMARFTIWRNHARASSAMFVYS